MNRVTVAGMLLLFVLAGCSKQGGIAGVESSGGSCLPGTDTCIESCAKGEPARCPNPGGTPRTCDCNHPWNQGRTEVV